jgi:hypothetical protein
VLAEDEPVVDVDVEDATSTLDELRLNAERLTNLLGQAPGLAGIVSGLAPDDLGLHREHSVFSV